MILIRKPVKQKVYDGTFIRPNIAAVYDYMSNDDDMPIEFVSVSEAKKYLHLIGYTDEDIFDEDIEYYKYRDQANWKTYNDSDLMDLIG